MENADEEIKSRVKAILKKHHGRKNVVRKDCIEGSGLLLRGWFKPALVSGTTRYGKIEVKSEDILVIAGSSAERAVDGKIVFHLTDGSMLAGKLKQEEISITTSYGHLKVPLTEIIAVSFEKQDDTITTAKSSNLKGKIEHDEFELDSQIGPVKIKRGKIAQITTGKAMIKDGNVAAGSSVGGATSGQFLVDGSFNRQQYAYSAVGSGMTIELKESYFLNAIGIYFYEESGYKFRYYVEVSNDNKEWKKVIDKEDKDYSGWQLDKFSGTPVKYIRITGTKTTYSGSNADTNFYIVEVEAYCKSENIRTPSLSGQQFDDLKNERHW